MAKTAHARRPAPRIETAARRAFEPTMPTARRQAKIDNRERNRRCQREKRDHQARRRIVQRLQHRRDQNPHADRRPDGDVRDRGDTPRRTLKARKQRENGDQQHEPEHRGRERNEVGDRRDDVRFDELAVGERIVSQHRVAGDGDEEERVERTRRRHDCWPTAQPAGRRHLRGCLATHHSPTYQVSRPGPTVAATPAPSARKVPNGSAYFIVPRLVAIRTESDERTGDRRHHQRHERQLPAEKGADHGQHLDVAHPEPFLVAHAVVDLRRSGTARRRRTTMPMSERHQPGSVKKLKAKPTAMPGSVMTFGSRWCSRSIANSTMQRAAEHQPRQRAAARDRSTTMRRANIAAVSASTIG